MSNKINESLPIKERLGQVGINNQGEKVTIIAYRKNNDIDIQFEDGIILTNKSYDNFLKGRMKHPIRYEQSFAHHIEVELGLDINKIWNWQKNTVSPYEITKQSHEKIWVYCLEKDYHNDNGGYETECSVFYKGIRCGYCNSKKIHPKDSFAQWGIDTFGEDFLEKYWSNKNTLNPWQLAQKSDKKVWILCQEKDYHNDNGGYEISCHNFYNGNKCSYCGNTKVHKLDSLGYLYPQIAQMIINDKRNNVTMEDMYKVAPFCKKKFYFKCSECGKESSNKKSLNNVVGKRFSCEYCSDGIPVPEKFMANVLEQLNIEFQTQLNKLTFEWCQEYRYDFYIPVLNMIVETHGMQHFERGFEHCGGRSLKEEQLNDKHKKELALTNNINSYIIVDCRYSKFDWLKENIVKELSFYFDLSNINWELAWKESQNSLVIKALDLWKKGYKKVAIAQELKVNRKTVENWLKNF